MIVIEASAPTTPSWAAGKMGQVVAVVKRKDAAAAWLALFAPSKDLPILPRRRRNAYLPTFSQTPLPPLKLLPVQVGKSRPRLGAIHTPLSAEPSLGAPRPLPSAAPSGRCSRVGNGERRPGAPEWRERYGGRGTEGEGGGRAGRGAVTARSRARPWLPPPEPTAPARGRPGARPAPRCARPPARRPPPAPVRLPPALAPSPPAPVPAALRPGKPPTRPGVPLTLAGLPAPAPGPQPYLGKIFSCRRRRQEGLSVAPSINSRRLGLPRGLGSAGLGVRSPALRRRP